MAEAQTCTVTQKQERKPASLQTKPPRVITVFPQLTEEEKRRTREDITRQLLAMLRERG